jgi:hypothetical protein
MDFAFDTRRLRVFEATVTPWPNRPSSILYVAFLREAGPAQSVGHAIVTDQRMKMPVPLMPLYCELVEVSVMSRGNGYGQELFLGIEERLGARMAAVATTPDGKKFLRKLDRPTDSLAQVMETMIAPLLTAPEVEKRLEEEERKLKELPPAQNPGHQDFTGDRFQTLAIIAPFSLAKLIVTMSDVPIQKRQSALELLLHIVSAGTSECRASRTDAI